MQGLAHAGIWIADCGIIPTITAAVKCSAVICGLGIAFFYVYQIMTVSSARPCKLVRLLPTLQLAQTQGGDRIDAKRARRVQQEKDAHQKSV